MRYQTLGFRFDVEAPDPASRAQIDALYALCRREPSGDETATETHRFVVERSADDAVMLTLDGETLLTGAPLALLVPTLAWAVNQHAVTSVDDAVLVHAGAVAEQGRAALLVGASGAGKTTLTARLVADGFDYLTDEAVAFDPVAGIVAPYPKPLKLEADATAHFGAAAAAARAAALEPAPDGSVLVAPAWLRADVRTGAAKPALLLAIEHVPGAPTSDAAISRAAMVVHLAQQSFNLGELGAAGFGNLAALAARCTCRTLQPGDLATASARVTALLTAEPGPLVAHTVEVVAADATRGEHPHPRAGLAVVRIDDELAVLDAEARRAHHLNAAATAVWDDADGSRSDGEIAEVLADRFGAPLTTVARDVRAVLAEFRAVGLFTDAR